MYRDLRDPAQGLGEQSPRAVYTTSMETMTTNVRNFDKGEPRIRVRTMAALLADDAVKPRKALLGEWLSERGLAMVFAPTGVGKSWFAMGVAAAVAGGGKFGSWEAPEPNKVLYIDGEMDTSDIKDRIRLIIDAAESGDRDQIASNILLCARHDQKNGVNLPDFGSEYEAENIIATVKKYRPALIVLDNISTLATVDDDNAAAAWDPFLKLLQRIQAEGVAALVVHHANKGGAEYRGSTKIVSIFETLVRMRPDAEHFGDGVAFVLDFTKARRFTEAGNVFNASFSEGRWTWGHLIDPKTKELVAKLLSGEFATQKEAAKALKLDEPTVTRKLQSAYRARLTTPEAIRGALKETRAQRKAEDDVLPDADDDMPVSNDF